MQNHLQFLPLMAIIEPIIFMQPKFIRTIIILLIVITNFGCDQVSKHIIREKVPYEDGYNYLGGHFLVTHVENTGAFLSLGNALTGPLKFILLTLLPVAALIGGLIWLITKTSINRLPLVAICFMIGGGIGNIYDRILHGSVTDFFYFSFGFLHTGVFNMADMSVTTGFFLLLFYSRFKRNKELVQGS
jgi:signal peptidase II